MSNRPIMAGHLVGYAAQSASEAVTASLKATSKGKKDDPSIVWSILGIMFGVISGLAKLCLIVF